MKPHYTNTNNPVDFPKSENKMNERIRDLVLKAQTQAAKETIQNSFSYEGKVFEKFAELIVRECLEQIHLECEDFENGNCFADDELWKSVTREYGKNKERGFNPVGMSIHFDKMLKQHFGVKK